MDNLIVLLITLNTNPNKNLVMTKDFDLFFNLKLDAAAKNAMLKIRFLRNFLNVKKLMFKWHLETKKDKNLSIYSFFI